MQYLIVILAWVFMIAVPSVYAGDTLKEYALKCDEAIGLSVEEFSCDSGTEVPDTHPSSTPAKYGAGETCDRPNHLNKECDPGSRFQVLKQTAEGFVVAHCRKRGQAHKNGKYKDIAVIQHSLKNGSTCFYQALGEDLDGLGLRLLKRPRLVVAAATITALSFGLRICLRLPEPEEVGCCRELWNRTPLIVRAIHIISSARTLPHGRPTRLRSTGIIATTATGWESAMCRFRELW
jgi:hypothetical protein